MNFSAAQNSDAQAVIEFYDLMIDRLKDTKYSPVWQKNVYPTDQALLDATNNGTMYLLKDDGRIIAAAILNQQANDGYENGNWRSRVPADQIGYLHLLAIHPDFQGRHLSLKLIDLLIDAAQQKGLSSLRLDVIDGNLPAMKAYAKAGFDYRGKQLLFYEDTGWMDFHLYELDI